MGMLVNIARRMFVRMWMFMNAGHGECIEFALPVPGGVFGELDALLSLIRWMGESDS
jgi:hypothetical protein